MEQIEEKLQLWLAEQHVRTTHPIYDQKFFEFIDAVVDYDGTFDSAWLRHELESYSDSLAEQQANHLIALFDVIVGYAKYARK